MIVSQPKSAYQAKKDGEWGPLLAEVHALSSLVELTDWRRAFLVRKRGLPEHWAELLNEAADVQEAEIRAHNSLREMDRYVGQIARGEL